MLSAKHVFLTAVDGGELFTYCIERSTEFQFFNEFSRLCEDEMQQWDAEKYPATNELFGTSIYTKSAVTQANVMRDPKGGHQAVARQKKATDKSEEKSEE